MSRSARAGSATEEVVTGSILATGDCQRLVDGADIVIHAAGLVRSDNADALRSVNVDGTARLMGAARAAGVKRFIYVSSTGVYGHPHTQVDEMSPRRPTGPYERSKAMAEAAVLEAAGWAKVIQPSNVIGSRHPMRPLRRLLARIASGRRLIHAHAWTNYVAVSDVARAIAVAATVESVPSVLIINNPLPLDELARLAGKAVGRPARLTAFPSALGSIIAPPLGFASRWAPSLGRLEALVDQTRFCTAQATWLRDSGLMPDLEATLAHMAKEYGLR